MQESLDRDLMILPHDVARILRTHSDRAARAHGMTRAQWIILARLARQPGISQNELAAICEVEPITVGRLVDRLEARGFVERCADPSDRRVRRLKLLPAAQPVLDDMAVYRGEMNAMLTESIPQGEREHLIDALLRIKDSLTTSGTSGARAQSARG
jgi:DNA-binding MarR family transcriptional regulator